ncbi:MAG: TIM barrel protein [Tepidisphaeraceae bacterium]|jgi:sugar phosphate isomerase/epimerase
MCHTPAIVRRRLAVVAACFDEDFRSAAKIARAAGFAALQLDSRLGDLDVLSLSQSGKRELQSILRSNELDLVGLRLDLGGKGLTADVDAALDRIEKLLAAAAGLQSPLLCLDPGPIPTDQVVDAALSELGRRADRHGVTIAFRGELAAFAALDRALKTAACPWFGLDLDPVAILKDDWSMDEIFSRLGGQIRHVRARDALAGPDHRTKPAVIGTGSVNWPRLLSDLDAAGYHGWITLDPVELPNRRAAATAGATSLWRA